MMFFGIYRITNLVNGKMYIGQHITSDLDDGYMGSGLHLKNALKKYGKSNFRKEWLMFCEDEEELNYMERALVDQTWVDRSDTYNLALGGQARMKSHSEKSKKKISEARKRYYENGGQNPMKGKHHSDKTKKKISAKASLRVGELNPFYGNHKFAGSNNPMYEKSSWANSSPEEALRRKRKYSNKMKQMKWWNNGVKQIRSIECPDGYSAGRLSRKVIGGGDNG